MSDSGRVIEENNPYHPNYSKPAGGDGRKDYLLIDVGDGEPIRGKYQEFLTRWKGSMSIVEDYLDALPDGAKASLTFQLFRWTQQELDDFCESHGIEWER